ncbi:unnamed protein product [Adineta steineri]|uniref:ABC transmembrane type-1 domain-containing protein n=1 Tax=Adineta steineri TaxID=433720 RepID=A0A815SVQ5_9BILA|nr:unnamed protein product [Adineta steineri]CAF1642909.1 unnamed protein product [Adineta steineri]
MTPRHDDSNSENDVNKTESNNQNNKDTSSHISVESDDIPVVSGKKRRFTVFSRIPILKKLTNPTKNTSRRLKLYEIYKFADNIDIFLMFIGIIAASGVGVTYGAMYWFNRHLLDNLILVGNDSMKMTNTINSNESQATNSSSKYNMTSPYNVIQSMSKNYIIVGGISIFLYWLAWASWMIAAERQIRRIRYKLFRNILCQEIGWFDIHGIGELDNRLNDNLDKVKNGLNEKVPAFLSLVSRIICLLIFAMITGWKLSLVFLSVSPLIILVYRITILITVKYTAIEIEAYSTAASIAEEALENIRTVTSFHGQQKEEERYSQNLLSAKKVGIGKSLCMGISQGLGQLLSFSAITLAFWYGLKLTRTESQNYTPGTLLIVLNSCLSVITLATNFIPCLHTFAEASASGSFVFDMIERKTKIDVSDDEGKKPETIKGDIEFKDVKFSYPTRQESYILQNFSIKIPSGKTIALIGASGCGQQLPGIISLGFIGIY